MFARRLPFTGGFAELITHHLLTAPKPPSTHAPVTPAMDRLILRCLEKDPKQRFESAAELSKALDAALAEVPEEADKPVAGPAAPPPPANTPVTSPVGSVAEHPPQPDTLSPAPGRTTPPLTQLPARDRRPLYVMIGVAAVAAVGLLAFATNRKGD